MLLKRNKIHLNNPLLALLLNSLKIKDKWILIKPTIKSVALDTINQLLLENLEKLPKILIFIFKME